MNKKITLTFTIFIIYILALAVPLAIVSAQLPTMPLAYNIVINYTNEHLNLISINLENAYIPDVTLEENYIVKLIDVNGKEAYTNTFSIPLVVSLSANGCIDDNGVYDAVKCGGPSYIKYDTAIKEIVVPYSYMGDVINIYSNDGELQLSLNVSEYADYCGDGKCTESYLSCPKDCKETVAEKTALDKYEKQYEMENKKSLWNKALELKYYIIVVLGLIIIILIVKSIRRKNPPEQQRPQGINSQIQRTIPPRS